MNIRVIKDALREIKEECLRLADCHDCRFFTDHSCAFGPRFPYKWVPDEIKEDKTKED